jgi:hypothetical protein
MAEFDLVVRGDRVVRCSRFQTQSDPSRMAEDRVAGRQEGRAADAGCIGKRPDAADAARDQPDARWMIGFGP